LTNEPVTAVEYAQLDDIDVTFHLKQWSHDADSILSDLASRFVRRRLFKAVDLDFTEEISDEFWGRAEQVVARAGFDPEYYLAWDRASDIPYYGYYSPASIDPRSQIYIETGAAGSHIREISEISEVVRGMRGYGINRVCFPAEVAADMSRLIEECTGQKHSSLAP
jgi:HD superfamily phosphohydrolase